MSQLRLLLVLLVVVVVGCRPSTEVSDPNGEADGDAKAASTDTLATLTSAHRVRSQGKLHCDRDSQEGFVEAARYFRRAAELESGNPLDQLNLAKSLVFTDALPQSNAAIEEAGKLFGDKPPVDYYYVLGLVRSRQQRYDEAAAAFTKVTDALPRHVKAWYNRGYMEEQAKRFEDAEKSYLALLAFKPRHRPANYRMSRVLRRLKRIEDSRKVLAVFQSIPESEAERDQEKCDLTLASLKPFDRAGNEAKRAKLTWRDASEELLGPAARLDGVRRAIGFDFGRDDELDLLIVGSTGLRIIDVGNAASAKTPVSPPETGNDAHELVVADFDNDTHLDAVTLANNGMTLFRGNDKGGLEKHDGNKLGDILQGTPIRSHAFDVDHDGDLDLVTIERRGADSEDVGACVLRNNGDLTFTRLEPFEQFTARAAANLRFDAHDVDQANDIDFVFTGSEGVTAFLNLRDGTFKPVGLGALGKRSVVLVEDLTNDGAPDFFAAGESGWTMARNADRSGAPYELRINEPTGESNGAVTDAAYGDLDNDGDLDIVLARDSGITVLRNHAGSLSADETIPISAGKPQSVEVLDLGCDGALEIVIVTDTGRVVALARKADPAYVGWRLLPTGGKDNHDAIGTVVEQYANQVYQNRMVKKHCGIHLGLGTTDIGELDGVRLRWPQGIVQALPGGQITTDEKDRHRFKQKEGLVASCPFLYVFGDDGWEYWTDCLGIAPLDEWLPPGTPTQKDPEEYVRIDGDALKVVDGRVRVAVTEELRETAYLDRLELVSVVHPAEFEVYNDESSRQGEYEPLRVFLVRRDGLHLPQRVRLDDGTIGNETIAKKDRDYLHGYADAPTQWGGWVDRYGIELTLEKPARALFMTGRIAWYDSTVVYSLWQHKRGWGPLRLEEKHKPLASTSVLIDNLGVPAGMDRTMVAVFADEAMPAGTRLKLSGHHRFLWDQLRFATDVEEIDLGEGTGTFKAKAGELTVQRMQVSTADLAFRGLSATRGDAARHEQEYLYDQADVDETYLPARGMATRYGDVAELLHEHDDLLVTVLTGDGIEVSFEVPEAPESGKRRTWFLRMSGWAKEASYHNRSGRWIDPLPVRGMKTYPPTAEETRDDEAYRAWKREYQTREVRRRPL